MTLHTPILDVQDLIVDFAGADGPNRAVDGIDFTIGRGEIVALVGESGSGKSASAMALLDLLPETAIRGGSAIFEGELDLMSLSGPQMRMIRGASVGVVFQEPMTALNPAYTIGKQLSMALRAHRALDKDEVRRRSLELLESVAMPDPERRLKQYPHQLSGGQRQRAMIAMAISGDPSLLIADEPTTALDVSVQAGILDLLHRLRETQGMSILLITHDMGVVADIADRVVVMRHGEVVEHNKVVPIFEKPHDPYTIQLLDSVPRRGHMLGGRGPRGVLDDERLDRLVIRDLTIEFGGSLITKPFRAVDGVSLDVAAGELVALVGESGSGKSTIGRAAVGLQKSTGGSVEVDGELLRGPAASASMVFQDPASSLDPRVTIGSSIVAPLRYRRRGLSRYELDERAGDLLEKVALPADWRHRYPHQLSGGQRQRIGLARALADNPALLVADEPTSALDVSVQQKVLELLLELHDELGFACLFITHDLSIVETLAHRTVVLRSGRIAEEGPTADVLLNPQDSYTQTLLEAAPIADPVAQRARRGRPLSETDYVVA
ncbi:dipeptide ABC transporter ATP-binding protein [Nesterenkonia suensis]